jgi:hypothetical protein
LDRNERELAALRTRLTRDDAVTLLGAGREAVVWGGKMSNAGRTAAANVVPERQQPRWQTAGRHDRFCLLPSTVS